LDLYLEVGKREAAFRFIKNMETQMASQDRKILGSDLRTSEPWRDSGIVSDRYYLLFSIKVYKNRFIPR